MKFFNSQNTLRSTKWKSKEYLIYFLNALGSFEVYRYDRNTGEHQLASIRELLYAEKVFVSYSYLGGIHLSNYSFSKSKVGSSYNFTFTLNSVVTINPIFSPNTEYWDIPNAIFYQKDRTSASWRGVEPVKVFSFNILATNPDQIYSVTYQTFTDIVFSQGGNRFSIEIGELPDSNILLGIREHPGTTYISTHYLALVEIFDDFIKSNNSVRLQSYLAGSISSMEDPQEFTKNYNLIAAYPCFFRIGGIWQRRIYFIENAVEAFHIDSTPSLFGRGYYVQNLQNSEVVDYNQTPFFEDNTVLEYYRLDNWLS